MSKRKWKLCEKFLKNRNEKLRSYINLTIFFFESVKRKSKRIYYSSKTLEFNNNVKNVWGVMKELMGKIRNTESSFT